LILLKKLKIFLQLISIHMNVTRMPSVKISFNAVQKDFPSACALLAGAKGLSAATWSTHAVTTDSTFKELILALATLRTELDPAVPDKKFCTVEQMAMVAREMGKCNKAISSGSTAMEAFLTDLGVSAKGGKLFFPHEENKTRPLCKTGRAEGYIEAVLMEDVPKRLTCITLAEAFALKKQSAAPKPAAGGGGGGAAAPATVQKIPVSIFRASEEAGISTVIEMHHMSRRKGCHVPAVSFWPALRTSMCSPAVVAKQVIGHDKRPVVELFVPCPGCVTHNELERAAGREVKEPEMIQLPFGAVCHFVQKVFKEEEAAKERPRLAVVPLMEDKSKLPIAMLYNFARASAAMRNPGLMAFRCPNAECLCAEEPRFFEPHAGCTRCISEFKSGAISHYHSMRCVSCNTEACGLCNKPRSAHSLDGEVCPRTSVVTEEMRVEGRKQNPQILYCRVCDVACYRGEGCAHLECGSCKHHFCALCEEATPMVAGSSRYRHECRMKGIHPDASIYHPRAAHMGMLDRAVVNPEAHHMIWTSQNLVAKGMRAFGRKQQARLLERMRVADVAAMAAGGGGAAAAVGGGGAAAAVGGGGAAAAVGGGGGALMVGGGAAAAGGGGALMVGGGLAAALVGMLLGGQGDALNDEELAEQMQEAEWGQ
jgi:hypothetical protein